MYSVAEDAMVPVNVWVALPKELVAVTVKLYAPETVAVPLIAPVEELIARPFGRVPPVTPQVMGVEPVATRAPESYAAFCVIVGSEVVVIVGAVPEAVTEPLKACTSEPAELEAVIENE